MADTIPDINLTGDSFQDIYVASGITVGASLIIQNKSNSSALIQVSGSQPTDSSRDGWLLLPFEGESVIIDSGESGCWVKGSGPIGVQEA